MTSPPLQSVVRAEIMRLGILRHSTSPVTKSHLDHTPWQVPPAKKGDALKDTSTPWEAHAVTEELAEAQRLAEAETISEFLDALNPGWAILYSAAFEVTRFT